MTMAVEPDTSSAALSKPLAAPAPLMRARGVSWEVICGVLAITLALLGVEWDFAWHRSIGRDTFWTPAHMMIYACGAINAIVCGYLVLGTTFGGSPAMRERSVRVFGFRAPLGGFMATWGGLAMLVSAPFDNWWHAAYGLDVALLSPPHILLFLGLIMVVTGFLILTCAEMNRAAEGGTASDPETYRKLQAIFLYTGGLNLLMYMLILQQRTELWLLHNTIPYKMLALTVPFIFALLAQAAPRKWSATWAVCVYLVVRIGAILLFPLFPASPKIGPVYTPVTRLIPAEFPILVIVPAVALDLLSMYTSRLRLWQRAAISGAVFTATLVAAEWPFADFLLTRAAANRFFGTIYLGFSTQVADRLPHLRQVQSGWPLMVGLLMATVYAMVSSWAGLRVGRWMRGVQR